MKKGIFFTVLICAVIAFSFGIPGDKDNIAVNNVVVRFEVTNGNGNNIWLDNFSIGTRYDNDLTIASMVLKDKNYLIPGVTTTTISPVVNI